MLFILYLSISVQRQVRHLAGRRPVPGAHAALHHVRQRAADHARGLRRQDHGVLDLHLNPRHLDYTMIFATI